MRFALLPSWAALLLIALSACAVQSSAAPVSVTTPLPSLAPSSASEVDLVDQHPLAVAGDAGWEYQRTASADFDGDGTLEQAILIAQVGLYNGRPAWEDGHVWQLYVEEPDGTRTYLYARFLPFGMLEARLASTNADKPAALILVEQTPQELGVYEVAYHGPQEVRSTELVRRELDILRFSGTPSF